MPNIKNVFSNSLEDLIDDYSSTVIYKQAEEAFKPLKGELAKDNPSDFDEALMGAIATLQIGLGMYAMGWIQSTLMPMIAKRVSIVFTYIVVGKIGSRIKRANFGGKAFRKATSLLTDLTSHRQKNTEIAMNMVQHTDTMMMRKSQTANDSKRSFDSNMLNSYSKGSLQAVELMSNKTKTGTWTNSQVDKKLYEKATQKKLASGVSWAKLYKKLNSFQEFAKNAEEQIINKAQVEFDTYVSNGLKKVQ